MAYAIGVVLALTLCARVSEGHFSSGITLVLVAMRKCTPIRGLRYSFLDSLHERRLKE